MLETAMRIEIRELISSLYSMYTKCAWRPKRWNKNIATFGKYELYTQQNSYSISHLLGTVTTQWLPLWRCSYCSLVPDIVTTEQWLHRTHVYHGAYVEICD